MIEHRKIEVCACMRVWPCPVDAEEQVAGFCPERGMQAAHVIPAGRARCVYAREAGLPPDWHYVRDVMDVRGWDRAGVEVHAVEGTYSPDQYEALEVARSRYVVRWVDLDATVPE